MKLSTSLFALLSVCAVFACSSGSTGGDDTGETDDELRKGKVCGGAAEIECPSGQVCHIPDSATGAHPKGRCEAPKPGEEGGICGGIAGFRCDEGLVCKMTGPHHPDQAGKCVKPAPGEEGGMCGGIAGIQCKDGFHCQFRPRIVMGMPIRRDAGSGPPPGAVGLPLPTGNGGGGPPPGAVGLPFPDQSGTCVADEVDEDDDSSGPPPGAVGLPMPPSH